MKYPSFLKKGDVIEVVAPSLGFFEEKDKDNFGYAKAFLEKRGYSVRTSESVFSLGRFWASAAPDKRAEEFTEAYLSDASAVFAASGGETELLILPYLDEKAFSGASPKWFTGYSDNTVLGYWLLTRLDTASVYGVNAGAFGYEPMDESVAYHLDLIEGKRFSFPSVRAFRNLRMDEVPECAGRKTVVCDTPSVWKTKGGEVTVSGRAIGGCLDLFPSFIGTPYDGTKEFAERYKSDGILWFLESCDLNPAGAVRALWQMKEAGWFEHASGFVFGRPHIGGDFFGTDFIGAVTEFLGTDVPMIFDADFGHKPPVLPVVNGSLMTASVFKGGKGSFSYRLE